MRRTIKPTILLDKSVIQSLAQEEIHFLFKYFYVNLPPILIREIMADLANNRKDIVNKEVRVKALALKLKETKPLCTKSA